jgi:TPR repeat protein
MRQYAVALRALVWVFVACGRGGPSSQGQPGPSSSVTIGLAIGTCEDIATCQRECDGGSADRCRRLGATYALGRGTDRDEARATELYERACAMNDPSACVFAGQMYEYAHGVPKDDVKAAGLYRRACDLHWAAGCYNLAIMYETGRGVAQDRARADDLYWVACSAGAQLACDRAKKMR